MTVKQYDPSQVLITFGAIPITGFADGEFLKVENDEDAFSLQVGTDGEACRSRSNNNAATITITLLQTSEANALLSAAHEADKLAPGGIGMQPLLIKDLLGSSQYQAAKCWVQKRPAATFGREAGPREWVLRTDNLISVDGGN